MVTSADARLQELIQTEAQALGFDLVGFAPAELPDHYRERWQSWLAKGHHGTMKYMENPRRGDVRAFYPWANTVISLGTFYYTQPPMQMEDPSWGRVSTYAYGSTDYHHYLRQMAEELASRLENLYGVQCAIACDSFPLLEKAYGEMAGLGWVGKNTCLIHQKGGSFFFLTEIITDLELPPTGPPPDRCGSCSACIDACPTGALIGPYQLDARRCISYLTIEFRGTIPRSLAEQMGNWIFGCDICQEVCPWNRRRKYTRHEVFAPQPISWHLNDLASIWEGGFRKLFQGTPLLRARRGGFLRNLLIAAHNANWHSWEFTFKALEDPSPLVRQQALELFFSESHKEEEKP